MNRYSDKCRRKAQLSLYIAAFMVLFACDLLQAQARGTISKNFYRIPYGDSVQITVNRDYVDHGATPAGNIGPMDIVGSAANQPLVAAAAGSVLVVNDLGNDCGCDGAYGGCANTIRILHANNEMTVHLHIAQNSATVNPGDIVTQGQTIATEGDVGWTCGGGRAPTAGTCIPSVPAGAGNCGRHLHWEVRRFSTNEFVNPMICGISDNIFADGGNYTGADCSTSGCSSTQNILTFSPYSGFGTFEVFQADNTITNANDFVIQDSASVVFHAGGSITLQPDFRAETNSYFRAEIGPCNTTPNASDF